MVEIHAIVFQLACVVGLNEICRRTFESTNGLVRLETKGRAQAAVQPMSTWPARRSRRWISAPESPAALAFTPREKDILMELKYKEKLYSRVIEAFLRKERRMDFIYTST